MNTKAVRPGWVDQGKSIRQLIAELKTFEDQDMKVEVSVDGGETSHAISLVGKVGGRCLLMFLDDESL